MQRFGTVFFVVLASTLLPVGCSCGDGLLTDNPCGPGSMPDFDTDVMHCGACFNACPAGLGSDPICVAGMCALECDDGAFDVDGDPANGCECIAAQTRGGDCQTCLPGGLAHNDLDDDCDGDALEAATRARFGCGADHQPCTIPDGMGDVRCVECEDCDDGARCEGIPLDDETLHARQVGREADCLNGLDDDGDGIIDNGPACEVLVASLSDPACARAPDTPGCERLLFFMGADEPTATNDDMLRWEDKPLRIVGLTHDFLVDRYEATRGQYAAFLNRPDRDDCSRSPVNPACEVSEADADLPVVNLSWCEAYAYCEALGKRLPAEIEWERMANGGRPSWTRDYPWSGRLRPGDFDPEYSDTGECTRETNECAFLPVTQGCCPTVEPASVRHPWGPGFVGDERLHHVAGNAWEWVHDLFLGDYEIFDALQPGAPVQWDRQATMALAPEHDIEWEGRVARAVRGGGVISDTRSARATNRWNQIPDEISSVAGVRCVRDFQAAGYERSAIARGIAADRPGPETCKPPCDETIIPRDDGRRWRVISLCVTDLSERPDQQLINSYLRQKIDTGEFNMLLDEAANGRLALGSAERHEDGWRWICEMTQLEIDDADCLQAGCVPASNRLDFGPVRVINRLPLEVERIDPWDGAAGACELPAVEEGDVAMRLTTRLDGDIARARIASNDPLPHFLCTLLRSNACTYEDGTPTRTTTGVCCEVETPFQACVDDCPGWPLEVEAILRPMAE